jgi:hypothetical protein
LQYQYFFEGKVTSLLISRKLYQFGTRKTSTLLSELRLDFANGPASMPQNRDSGSF